MSYFNPRIYNKENLKEDDRRELEFWRDQFHNVIENAKDSALDESGSPTLDKMKSELIGTFCEHLKIALGYAIQEIVVGTIEGYNTEIPERDTYETFLYDDEEEQK